jgi:hypothetical protein
MEINSNQTVSITKDYNILPTDCTIICDAETGPYY